MTMEKLGVATADLLAELQAEYQALKEKEASLIKTGSADMGSLPQDIAAVAAKIDQLQSQTQ